MTEKQRKPDPQRVAFLRALPMQIKEQISGSEAENFIYGEDIPEPLYEKIKDYLEEVPEGKKS